MVKNLHSSFPINAYLSSKIHSSPAQTAGVEARSVTLKTIFAISEWPVHPKMCPTSTSSWASEIVSKNTKHMPCSWLTYHPWCQTTALWRALVFWSGDTCHAGHAVGKAWSWDTNNQVLGRTWSPEMCGHGLVPLFLGLYFLTWQVITEALRPLVQNTCDYMILQSNRIIATCSIYSKSFFGILLVIRYLRAVVPNMGYIPHRGQSDF